MDPNTQETSEEQRAREALVFILSGQAGLSGAALLGAAVGAIALLLPAVITGALRDAVSLDIARMVMRDYPRDTSSSGALSVASQENIAYRVLYGISAAKRAVATLIGPSEAPISERLAKWEQAERSYFEAHQLAAERRLKVESFLEAAAEMYGPVLGWRHGDPAEPRMSHLKADGANFKAGQPPIETDGFPGTLPNCTCTPGAPFPRGRMLR